MVSLEDSFVGSSQSPQSQRHAQSPSPSSSTPPPPASKKVKSFLSSLRPSKLSSILKKYMKFIGPGLMVSVAYMDPGNYSTAVAAGSAYKYNLLFSILLSNCLAIFLQILSAKLGAVTGLDLAANCRANLSFKLNIFIYILAEIAIIATDLAEVVGTAIALNILFKLPLFLGVVVTVVDVLIVLMAYKPNGPLLFIRIFESFVSVLVAATVFCFGIELYQVSHDSSVNFSTWEVLKGFLPNDKVVDMSDRDGGNGLFLSLAILGATVMPHSLYLGSGLVQARLKDFDIKNGFYHPPSPPTISGELPQEQQQQHDDSSVDARLLQNETSTPTQKVAPLNETTDEIDDYYRPSIHAINDTMTYTMVELVISLFTVALFVNAAILIVAGATLDRSSNNQSSSLFSLMRRHDDDDGHHSDHDTDYESSDDDYANADLFTIYHLLSTHLSPTAGFVFALALLCSGQSAGVVCTLAGQMVSEGFLSWSLPPVTRRLITRGLAIIPCLLVVSFAGREGLSKVLNASQVVLSILLPVVSAPLIWFTCSKNIMRVPLLVRDGDEDADTIFGYEDESGLETTITNSSISDGGGANRDITGTSSTSTTFAKATNSILPGDHIDKLTRDRSNRSTKLNDNLKRYQTTEPAIRLNNLRNSHPCVGWEDEDDEFDDHEQRRLMLDRNHPYNHETDDEHNDEDSTLYNGGQTPNGVKKGKDTNKKTTNSETHAKTNKNRLHYSSREHRDATQMDPNQLSSNANNTHSNNASDADIEDEDILSDGNATNFDLDDLCDANQDIYRVKGFKDMSNGPITSFVAILVWGFVASLNLFLIGSMVLGYDVPF